MLKLLLRLLWWDETAAAGLMRAVFQALGAAVATGLLDVARFGLEEGTGRWLGIALLAAGGWVRSSTAHQVQAERRAQGAPPSS